MSHIKSPILVSSWFVESAIFEQSMNAQNSANQKQTTPPHPNMLEAGLDDDDDDEKAATKQQSNTSNMMMPSMLPRREATDDSYPLFVSSPRVVRETSTKREFGDEQTSHSLFGTLKHESIGERVKRWLLRRVSSMRASVVGAHRSRQVYVIQPVAETKPSIAGGGDGALFASRCSSTTSTTLLNNSFSGVPTSFANYFASPIVGPLPPASCSSNHNKTEFGPSNSSLPNNNNKQSESNAAQTAAREKCTKVSGVLFKAYLVLSMVAIFSAYTILVSYSRDERSTGRSSDQLYFSTTAVFMSECAKVVVTLAFLFVFDGGARLHRFWTILKSEFFGKPRELLKMSVPSLAYALQNNLEFVALANLAPSVYQVTTQLKIPVTALFMVIILGKHFSYRRWLSILLLCAGVAVLQMENVDDLLAGLGFVAQQQTNNEASSSSSHTLGRNAAIGLAAILLKSVATGFASVYFEYMIKGGGSSSSSTTFWVRNLQLYVCGTIATFGCCVAKDGREVWRNGFFHGYDPLVCIVVLLFTLGGIYISLVTRYLDNVHRIFASTASIIVVVLVSCYLLPVLLGPDARLPPAPTLGPIFFGGLSAVVISILLYNFWK